ncbi:MAG: hypothetical protein OXC07_03350 [Kistimonas sp.]|nr:hypothetical protein [Kistimonas sp.]
MRIENRLPPGRRCNRTCLYRPASPLLEKGQDIALKRNHKVTTLITASHGNPAPGSGAGGPLPIQQQPLHRLALSPVPEPVVETDLRLPLCQLYTP